MNIEYNQCSLGQWYAKMDHAFGYHDSNIKFESMHTARIRWAEWLSLTIEDICEKFLKWQYKKDVAFLKDVIDTKKGGQYHHPL